MVKRKLSIAGFVLRPDSPEIKELFEKIKKQFIDSGIEVMLDETSSKMIGHTGVNFDIMCKKSDFLVSLGGDGTLLSLVRSSYKHQKPVVGINAGTLGFLADITIEDVDIFLEQLSNDEYRIDERMAIEGVVKKENGVEETFFAFNDVFITRPTIAKMIKVKASIDNEWFNTYRGDGLIISTPTGSTAYNMAAGGPIVYPLTKALIISAVSAHSLTNQTPLVIPSDMTIGLNSPDDIVLAVVDGQDHYEMGVNDTLEISGARVPVKLLHRKERNYFSVLRDKLSWGDKQ